jgi:CubicO group peptidase (beta-lactamase class C family)
MIGSSYEFIMSRTSLFFLALLVWVHGCALTAMGQGDASVLSPPPKERHGDEEIAAFFDSYVSGAVAEKGIPGAAVVLVRDGRVFFERTYGVADYASRRPISTEDSLLRQGSTAKMFTWVLTMQLVEEGRLDLDADVNQYLDFRIPDAFGAPVTMRHLLTHTAGFADRMPLVKWETRQAPFNVRVRENIPERVYAPGSTVAYSNYGAALAGYVVERLRGKPFERVVEERIFAPLAMTRSTLEQPLPEHLRPLLVSGYSASGRTPAPFDFVSLPPTGSASASPGDMGRFVAALMPGGSPRILGPETLALMMRLQQPLGPGLRSGLGYGFIVGEYRGVRYAGHGGSMPAGATDFEILPEKGLGWYVGFNGRGVNGAAIPLRQELLRAVIDRFYAPAAEPETPGGPSNAKELAGKYLPTRRMHSGVMQVFGALGPLSVSADGDELLIELEGGQTRWLPAGRDRFVEQRTGLPLAVERDSEGRIVRLGSPLLNSVSQYEPAPASVRYLPVLLLAPAALLIYALSASAGWAVRELRRDVASRRPEPSRLSRATRRASAVALWLILLTTVGWALYLVMQTADPDTLSAIPGLPLALNLLSAAAASASALVVADALVVWRDPSRGPWAAAGKAAAACASCAVAWLFIAFDFARVGPW